MKNSLRKVHGLPPWLLAEMLTYYMQEPNSFTLELFMNKLRRGPFSDLQLMQAEAYAPEFEAIASTLHRKSKEIVGDEKT